MGATGGGPSPAALPSGHLNVPEALAPTVRPPLVPSSAPAEGAWNRMPEAGANSLPWMPGGKGGGGELWEQTIPWLRGAWPWGNGSV